MFLAYGFFLSMTISYIVIIPPLYRVTEVSEGLVKPYPEILSDSLTIIKVFFTNSMLLWFTLWSVKFSVLFLYRRLMIGLPKYLVWWWAVLAFCVVVRIVQMQPSVLENAEIYHRPSSVLLFPTSHPARACTPGLLPVSVVHSILKLPCLGYKLHRANFPLCSRSLHHTS